jgi:hypothetical protein
MSLWPRATQNLTLRKENETTTVSSAIFRHLVAGFPPRWPEFVPIVNHAGFMVDMAQFTVPWLPLPISISQAAAYN